MNIDSIQNGVVLDHIQAGKSMDIYRYLHLDQLDCSVAIIKNVRSGRMGKKDIWNVNGSYMNIEGITSPDGRILGKMAHSERRGDGVAINIYGQQDIKIFESGVEYFK